MQPLPKNIDIFITADGSPTLQFRRDDGYVEKMHHSGGALNESLYIYHGALKRVLERGAEPRVLSMGLGLGYNELITLAELISNQKTLGPIWSFESHPDLRQEFLAWAQGAMSTRLNEVTEDLLVQISQRFAIRPETLKQELSGALNSGSLQVRGAFPEDAAGVDGCNLVYYDAYSNKMDAGLWDENMLVERPGGCLGPDCVLATYAATGALNRALKRLGFHLLDKPGFLGKRESTLAVRGDFCEP